MSAARDMAATWFARRRGGPLKEAEQQAFDAWLSEDVEHRIAYAGAERAWVVAQAVRADPRVQARRQALGKATSRRFVLGRALAAGLAAAVVLSGGALTVQHLTGPRPLVTQAFRTDVGQRSTVTLPDGSVVTLNTDTVVRTRADGERRLVYLEKGQAYFRVAKDRRHPFVVSAAGRTVTALGTAFDVRVDAGALKVVLVEGKVRVESPPLVQPAGGEAAKDIQATEMVAGSQLVAPDDAEWRLSRANTVRETSWIHGQIIFDDEPLGDVVAELNRYTEQKMVLTDADLAAKSISGAFKPGDMRGFARSLEAYRLASVEMGDHGEMRLAPFR